MKTDGTTKEAGAVGATPTEGKPASESKQIKPMDSIGAMIERLKPQLAKALPKHVTPERLARVALTAIRNNPKLGQAEAVSLMGAIMTAAQLGLEPNTPLGQCYLIPYRDNKNNTTNAQFQMGYQGIIDLAYRTEKYQVIDAIAVDKNDVFEYEYGLHGFVRHVPAEKPSGEVVYYYAYYKLVNGGYNFKVWSKDKVQLHAQQYSKAWSKDKKEFQYGSSWRDSFDGMAKKTVLIDVLKYAPKSIELSRATAADNMTTVINPDDPDLNIDTLPGDFELQGE